DNKHAQLFSLNRTGAVITKALKVEPEEFHDGVESIASSGKFVEVAKVKDVHEGSPHCAEAGGMKIAIFKVKGKYYAIDNKCSHEGGPLCQGMLKGTVIDCPWHGSEFDVTSGAVVKPPAHKPQMTFSVRVKGDSIEVQL
ncbi:MAG: non-heme iron oxygenase ferredoxin subunit, partial [Methanobacteriota archaeon]